MADASAMLKTPSTQLTLERRLRERPTHIKPQHGRNYTKLSSSYGLGPTNSFYPDDRDADRTVVIFSADGIMKILGYPSKKELRKPVDEFLRKRKWVCDVESICLGATFAVAATNGLDITRRVNFQGFCQSPDILGESIQDAVLGRGGEVVESEKLTKNGAEESLVMTVSVPLLFGVPPEMDTLRSAIEVGGGFLHRMYGEWYIY